MHCWGLKQIVLTAASTLAIATASAQAVDDRFPHLSQAANSAPAPARMQASAEAPSPALAAVAAASFRLADPVPFPRPAPNKPTRTVSIEAVSSSVARVSAPVGQYAYAGPSAAVTAAFSSLEEARQPEQPAPQPLLAAVPMPPVRPQPKDQARVAALDPTDIAVMVENTAVAHDVPLELAHAVVRVESNYNPRATGSDGTVGLMQIKPATARGLGFSGSARELYQPKTNLEWGIRYLAGARKLAKGNVCRTVLKYQGGHGAERMTNASATYCGKVKTLIARPIARVASRP